MSNLTSDQTGHALHYLGIKYDEGITWYSLVLNGNRI